MHNPIRTFTTWKKHRLCWSFDLWEISCFLHLLAQLAIILQVFLNLMVSNYIASFPWTWWLTYLAIQQERVRGPENGGQGWHANERFIPLMNTGRLSTRILKIGYQAHGKSMLHPYYHVHLISKERYPYNHSDEHRTSVHADTEDLVIKLEKDLWYIHIIMSILFRRSVTKQGPASFRTISGPCVLP